MTFETRSEGMEGVRNAELQLRILRARRQAANLAAAQLGRPFMPLAAEAGPLSAELTQLLQNIMGEEGGATPQPEGEAMSLEQPLPEMRGRPAGPAYRLPAATAAAFPLPPGCAFLRPGQQFEGRQRVAAHLGANPKQEMWEVSATIQHYDRERGALAGTMQASNVPDAPAPVMTFFEGEIIDNVNHTFFTSDWDACSDTDFFHWSQFDSFKGLHAEVVRHGGRCPSLATHPYVYLRWKEQLFLSGGECRLSINGFYYLRLCRTTGNIDGYYYDPSSSPDQKLSLGAVRAGPAGYAFPAFDLA